MDTIYLALVVWHRPLYIAVVRVHTHAQISTDYCMRGEKAE